MANFGGRYTCPDCDVDGAVDVRRVTLECKDASGCKDDTRLAARAAARPSAPQEAMACFKIKQVLGVS